MLGDITRLGKIKTIRGMHSTMAHSQLSSKYHVLALREFVLQYGMQVVDWLLASTSDSQTKQAERQVSMTTCTFQKTRAGDHYIHVCFLGDFSVYKISIIRLPR